MGFDEKAGNRISSSSSRSSSSSSSSSGKKDPKKKKARERKQKEQEKKDALKAKIQEKLAQRDHAESQWHGWICPCGCKNLTMKARCTNCYQLKPLNAAQRGMGSVVARTAAAIERAHVSQPANPSRGRSRSRSRSRSSRSKSRKKRSRSRSSSSSSSPKKRNCGDSTLIEAIEKAKREALQHFSDIMKMAEKEKMKAFRQLLREWHPDKNMHRVEVAKEVFQFLQKAGKTLK